MTYEIRIANENDRKKLTKFIDEYWKQNHIFVNNKELLDWQHFDCVRKRYNFVIGIEKKTDLIHAILGFIPLTQFDSDIELERLCWMAIWKVQDAARGNNLGRHLLSYLEEIIKPNVLSAIAASEMSLSLYQARGYQIGRLNHYFILNPQKKYFQLAIVNNLARFCTVQNTQDSDKRLEQTSENDITNGTANCFLAQKELPRKSLAYLINRYCQHPFYCYQLFRIIEGFDTIGIIVTRICSHGTHRAIRIVDFVGPSDALCGLQNQWIYLLKNVDAEYIDFYNAGINENDLIASGFTRRKADDDIVIPNHFEPFSRKNVEMNYMISTPVGQPYRIVKGDGDQDRPNIISEEKESEHARINNCDVSLCS